MTIKIHEGFAEGLAALNATLPSRDMVASPFGRAYKAHSTLNKDFDFYAGRILFGSVGEEAENHIALMQEIAREREAFAGRVYMGAAGLLNLSYIDAIRPGAVLFYDVNPIQTLFWNIAIETAANCPKLDDFLSFIDWAPTLLIGQVMAHAGEVYLQDHCIRKATAATPRIAMGMTVHSNSGVLLDKNGDGLWRNAKGYAHFHALAKSGAAGAITLDVLDRKGWAQLAGHFGRQADPLARHAGIAYVSNIFLHLNGLNDWTGRHGRLRAEKDHARSNMQCVTDPKGVAIIDEQACLSLEWPQDRPRKRPKLLRDVWKQLELPQARKAALSTPKPKGPRFH